MLQITLKRFSDYYSRKNRWWIPFLCGLPFIVALPPFNHELHPIFSLFPVLNLVVIVPLLSVSLQRSRRRAVLHAWLYGTSIGFGQCFWLYFVKIEGLWLLIVFAMLLLSAFVGLFFLVAGMAFRWSYRAFPRLYLLFYPACWILIDYSRTLGELCFPWGFLGYNFTPVLPISQFASLTGVWGVTFIAVMGNLIVWEVLVALYRTGSCRSVLPCAAIFTVAVAACAVWGYVRVAGISSGAQSVEVALLQTSIDQLNWGTSSLDTSFAITDSMVKSASTCRPDLIVGPESALLCFLSRQSVYRRRVCGLADSAGIPILLGALHWDRAPQGSVYDYLVYNTAFLIRPGQCELEPYRKIILVPFSENFPFEVTFPILSRVNLGEADFKRGKEHVVYRVNDSVRAAPVICYEMAFPGFVRKRLQKGANLLVHITNDGWFGRTTGPHQHAIMARMRCIENGVGMARCAITGVSMFVDPSGRVSGKTGLGERTILYGSVPLRSATTLYARYGDWFVVLCAVLSIFFIPTGVLRQFFLKKRSAADCSPPPGMDTHLKT